MEQKEKMEELTIKFAKGLAEAFTSKDGKELMRIKIPNIDPNDHSPWMSFVLPAKAVHEKQCENELTGYENSSLPVEVVLRKNTKYKELFLFQWVLEDLKNIFPSSSASLPEVGGE